MVQIEANTNDWRVALFGPLINMAGDEEVLGLGGKKIALPVEEAFDKSKYDYIAVFVGADHCKYCEEFAPAVVKSSFALETKRKCKVVFVSGDRSEEAFEKSCNKLQGIIFLLVFLRCHRHKSMVVFVAVAIMIDIHSDIDANRQSAALELQYSITNFYNIFIQIKQYASFLPLSSPQCSQTGHPNNSERTNETFGHSFFLSVTSEYSLLLSK